MHRPGLYLLFLVALFIMPHQAYAQETTGSPLTVEAGKFANLPAQARVFAFSAENYNHTARVKVAIDPSTPTSYLREITINSPSQPMILLLQANDASIWHFNWTKGSQIAAVHISGRYRQVVSGLPENVPVYISDQTDPANTDLLNEILPPLLDLAGFNDLAQHLFQRDVEEFHLIKKGEKEVVAGPPLAENAQLESAEKLDLENSDFRPILCPARPA